MTPTTETAIIAATAALSGVAISQLFSFFFLKIENRHKKQAVLREKLEQIGLHFSSSLEYLSKISACRNQQALLTLNTRTHTQKACVLSVIYFPSLSTSLQSYALAEADLFQAAVSSYNPQNPEGRVGLGMLNKAERKRIKCPHCFKNRGTTHDTYHRNSHHRSHRRTLRRSHLTTVLILFLKNRKPS
jgi:hypothetical protein